MEIITQSKKKEKRKLTSFFNSFTETPKVPVGKESDDAPLISLAFVSGQLAAIPKNYDELIEIKTDHFHAVINRHIAAGIKFEVSADDFRIIDAGEKLKTSDREFLKLNESYILCQLQQSLLMKHLFLHSPNAFEDFAFEVMERESLLSLTAKTNYEIYVEAVKQTTKTWFQELLENG